jgi:hypothetical protein
MVPCYIAAVRQWEPKSHWRRAIHNMSDIIGQQTLHIDAHLFEI